jgi:hypothetical protein
MERRTQISPRFYEETWKSSKEQEADEYTKALSESEREEGRFLILD